MSKKLVSQNRKAYHEFHIFDKYIAGMVLTGTEIKSIRKGAVNLKDSFVKIDAAEAFLHKCHISPYEQGNRYNVNPERVRKLLLNKKEIEKIIGKIKKEGYTIVPTELFIQDGWAKLEIALAKGKKLHDKRDDLAKKAQTRDIQRAMKR